MRLCWEGITTEKVKAFLKRKDIVISVRRYGIDALGAMAQGLFCSLLIGTIIDTVGAQFGIPFLTMPVATVSDVSYTVGGLASAMSGPAMAVAIGYALRCPPLVLFSLITVGFASNALGGAGGPLAVLFVAVIAAELGKALEPLHIMYFEEPTSPENPSNFRHIKQKCDLPLATGERSYTRWGFRQFFEDRTLSVIQPDLCNTGGITETKKICDMAQVYDMGVQIHVCGGPIATAAALQVEAAIPNFTIHEEHNANLKNIFIQAGKYYYKPENGYYTVPDLPGIGQEMTDEFLATCRKVVIGG